MYAYLIDRQETVNRIKIVENKTHIEEEFDPADDPGPGSVIKKKPCIVNDSVIPVYVRVRVVFSNLDAQAQCEPLKISRQLENRRRRILLLSETASARTANRYGF